MTGRTPPSVFSREANEERDFKPETQTESESGNEGMLITECSIRGPADQCWAVYRTDGKNGDCAEERERQRGGRVWTERLRVLTFLYLVYRYLHSFRCCEICNKWVYFLIYAGNRTVPVLFIPSLPLRFSLSFLPPLSPLFSSSSSFSVDGDCEEEETERETSVHVTDSEW